VGGRAEEPRRHEGHEVKTLVIIDSQGPGGISDEYRALLPHCVIEGYEPMTAAGQVCHPHGLMVAQLAGVVAREPTRLVFLRIFGAGAVAISGGTDWALDAMAELDLPAGTVICRSWGMSPRGGLGPAMGIIVYGAWVDRYTGLLKSRGWVDFGAAGNSDQNDSRPDVSYPQALMPGHSNIIGSHDRAGIPSRFSGDGKGVQCLFWAEHILLRTAMGWSVGSGTSFAAPKAAGVCCALGLDNEGWRKYVGETAPSGWAQPWHPKYGFGSREHLWQNAMMIINPRLWPPCDVARSMAEPLGFAEETQPDEWFDFAPKKGGA